jgi:hypothetical protein
MEIPIDKGKVRSLRCTQFWQEHSNLGQPPEPPINRAPLRRIRLTVYGISDRSTGQSSFSFFTYFILFLRISWNQLPGNRDKQRKKRYTRGIGGGREVGAG